MISRRICKLILITGSIVILSSSTVFAQLAKSAGQQDDEVRKHYTASMAPGVSKSSQADKQFAKGSFAGSMTEIALGHLAAKKGGAADVKQFGRKMIADHTKLNHNLRRIAQKMGVDLPKQLPHKAQALESKLQSESGKRFDRTYIEAMVKDHRKVLHAFRKEAHQGKNQRLKRFASSGERIIEGHLRLAEQMAQRHHVTVSEK